MVPQEIQEALEELDERAKAALMLAAHEESEEENEDEAD